MLFLKIVFEFNKLEDAKMIRKTLLAAVALFAALLTGCTVVRELPPQEATEEMRQSPEYKLAREMLDCFIRGDGDTFVANMAPKGQSQLTAEQFKKFRAEIVEARGEPVSFRYVTALEMPIDFKPQIWAVRMKKTNAQSGKEFFQEILFRVVTARADGRVYVLSVNFL